MVLVGSSHALDDLFTLGLGDTTAFGNYLGEDGIDFTGHTGGVTADVEESLLAEELVDFGSVLLEAVLDVDLLGRFAGESGNEFELVAEDLLVFL